MVSQKEDKDIVLQELLSNKQDAILIVILSYLRNLVLIRAHGLMRRDIFMMLDSIKERRLSVQIHQSVVRVELKGQLVNVRLMG